MQNLLQNFRFFWYVKEFTRKDDKNAMNVKRSEDCFIKSTGKWKEVGYHHRHPCQRTPTLRCLLLGSAGAGKTSLLRRYFHGTFNRRRNSTMGADFYSKKVSNPFFMNGVLGMEQRFDDDKRSRIAAGLRTRGSKKKKKRKEKKSKKKKKQEGSRLISTDDVQFSQSTENVSSCSGFSQINRPFMTSPEISREPYIFLQMW